MPAIDKKNETFNPEGHNTFSPTYSHISRVPISETSSLISFAGQVGHDSSNNTIPPTLGEQCSLAFANIDKCLEASGGKKEDIIQVRQYVVNLLRDGQGQDSERAKRYAEWMGGLKPPSTLIGVQALAHKDLFYEIEVVCVVHDREGQK